MKRAQQTCADAAARLKGKVPGELLPGVNGMSESMLMFV
jgi:hypothetical protein